jgi:hypothetical protein
MRNREAPLGPGGGLAWLVASSDPPAAGRRARRVTCCTHRPAAAVHSGSRTYVPVAQGAARP